MQIFVITVWWFPLQSVLVLLVPGGFFYIMLLSWFFLIWAYFILYSAKVQIRQDVTDCHDVFKHNKMSKISLRVMFLQNRVNIRTCFIEQIKFLSVYKRRTTGKVFENMLSEFVKWSADHHESLLLYCLLLVKPGNTHLDCKASLFCRAQLRHSKSFPEA